MSIVALQAAVDKSAAFNGSSVDISAITSGNVVVRVNSLTAGKKARLTLQTSVDAFTASKTLASKVFEGVVAPSSKEWSVPITRANEPRFGTASAVLRLIVESIDGSATINYQADIEKTN